MKITTIIAIILTLATACTTIDLDELKSINNSEFQLKIEPDYDLYQLRFDLENTDNTTYDDEEITTTSLPYHELGFDLGNGLFFDLNNNLSFRLDKLLNIEEGEHFELLRDKTPNSSTKTKYKFELSAFSKKSSLSFNYNEKFKIQHFYDSVSVTEKHKLKYAIVKQDSTLLKKNDRKVKKAIYHHDYNFWTTSTNSDKGDFFYLEDDYININETYILECSEDRTKLKIFTVGSSKDYLSYTIERDNNSLYIYNEKDRGYKIEMDNNEIRIYHNQKLTEIVSRIK